MQTLFPIRRWAAALLAITMVAVIAGCGSKQSPAPQGSGPAPTPMTKEPLTQIVIAQSADAISLDPQKQSDTNTGNIVHNIFDGLLLRAADLSLQPGLATSWTQLGPTQWELKLRTGVQFQNGEEFNADAVKFTMDRMQDPNTKALQATYFTLIKKTEVVDPQTVRFTTSEPDPIFLARMSNLLIIPPKYIKEKGDDYFAKNPVGTGPYKFVEWVKDDHITLEADPNHWRGKPAIPKVIWKPVPEMATRIAGLQGGQIDLISSIPADQIKTLEGSKNVKIVTTPSAQIQMLQFNTKVAPADNKDFRMAVAYAVNPKPIMEALLGNYASPLNIPLSAVIPGIPSGIAPWPYDVAKAKEFLAKAGFPNGTSIDFVCQNGTYPLDKDIAQAIAQQLAAVGIKANVKPTEYSQFLTQLKAKTISPVYLEGGNNIWFDVDPQITAFYASNGSLSTYSNKDLDALIAKGRTGQTPDERKAAYTQAYQLMKDDAAGVPILQYTLVSATSARIDWKARPDARIRILEISPK